jgi:surface polysaccharide O-acyltransferase-like enzyme
MTPERRVQAIAYSEIKNVLYFVTTFYSFLILILFLVTGSSAKIRAWATRLGNSISLCWLCIYSPST